MKAFQHAEMGLASEFALDLRRSLAPSNHLWVNSGWSTVNPAAGTVCGVDDCHAPPLAGRGLRLRVTFVANGHRIIDDGNYGKGDVGLLYAGGTWRPDRIERHGTYHYEVSGRLCSLRVESRLVPLHGRAGYLLRLRVVNRGSRRVRLAVEPSLDPGSPALQPLENWNYAAPAAGAAAVAVAPGLWTNAQAQVALLRGASAAPVHPGDEARYDLAVLLLPAGAPTPRPAFDLWERESQAALQRRLRACLAAFPRVTSTEPALDEYYRRALVSGFVCLWDNPAFTAGTPHVATSGIDGGALCTYLWDTGGYIPDTLVMMLGPHVKRFLRTAAGILGEHYAVAANGAGVGPFYAYNVWSFTSLAWAAFRRLGPDADLFGLALAATEDQEQRLPRYGDLLDFGTNRNLLEMRSRAWEHVTASPNAERAWCFARLADMAERMGRRREAPALRSRGRRIAQAVREDLWDARAGWFRCVWPGSDDPELVYSIQAFDALRTGVCLPAMRRALLRHVRDGAFLGACGVSSISAEDERHYELNDPDWSGGGAYTGDGPTLALTLWELGEEDHAWDVLRRFFWMGRHLPYYPQEHACDRPASPAHKRANICSGLAGAEAILLGLFGAVVDADGVLRLRPRPPRQGTFRLDGLAFGGRRIDVEMDSSRCRVVVDGRDFYAGPLAGIPPVT